MSIQLKLMVWLLSVGMVFIVLFGSYRYGRHVEGLERDRVRLQEEQTQAKHIKEAAEQHDNDQLTINNLAYELNKRVRIHIPTCFTQEDSNRGTGTFSEQLDAALAEVRADDARDSQRCDQLNVDAIEVNNSIR